MPTQGKRLVLEIRGDSTTIVDGVHGRAKLKSKGSTIASVRNLLREWCGRGVDLRQRVADWATHIFGEHNEEADSWAGNGVKGCETEWVDIANVVGSDVTGLCVLWGR